MEVSASTKQTVRHRRHTSERESGTPTEEQQGSVSTSRSVHTQRVVTTVHRSVRRVSLENGCFIQSDISYASAPCLLLRPGRWGEDGMVARLLA